MKIIKQVPMLILIAIFLISCRTSTYKEYPTNNLEKNIEDNPNSEKKRMEIKFSCGEDGISESDFQEFIDGPEGVNMGMKSINNNLLKIDLELTGGQTPYERKFA